DDGCAGRSARDAWWRGAGTWGAPGSGDRAKLAMRKKYRVSDHRWGASWEHRPKIRVRQDKRQHSFPTIASAKRPRMNPGFIRGRFALVLGLVEVLQAYATRQ